MEMNTEKFKAVLESYKNDFNKYWPYENFKWEAIKTFQDNWDINAQNFTEMLDKSLSKTGKLLTSYNNYPKSMICNISGEYPNEVRMLFENLFDETMNLSERIVNFSISVENLRKKSIAKHPTWRNHYQNYNAITTYLWLKYPDKYYIYKYGEFKSVFDKLGISVKLKTGVDTKPIIDSFEAYDYIRKELSKDKNLTKKMSEAIAKSPEKFFNDNHFNTLTIDFGFYISRKYKEKIPQPAVPPESDSYSKPDFLSEVFLDENSYENLSRLLLKKQNIILQGAPGVGKTFAAKRLAYSIIGCKDDSKIETVQFHQNYNYEDFIMGYKPTENGFKLEDGVFYRFCKKAENDPDGKYFFIIDEINRGNLSKIFGELLMLIENDHRKEKIRLAYRDELFSVPKNLYIIGTMNTADRSLAMIDYALRRRFSFFNMKPAFESEQFINYQKSLNNNKLDSLVKSIIAVNEKICNEPSLGEGFQIGHSYFCGINNCNDCDLDDIVNFDILPTLKEYWFDNEDKYEDCADILKSSIR